MTDNQEEFSEKFDEDVMNSGAQLNPSRIIKRKFCFSQLFDSAMSDHTWVIVGLFEEI